ncbi:outer membrane protein assembly factor BamA [Candidatus Dependentiae bacterium]
MIPSRKSIYKTVCLAIFEISILLSCANISAKLHKDSQQGATEQNTAINQDIPQSATTPSMTNNMPNSMANRAHAPTPRIIKNIVISGNKLVDKQAILNRLPYKIGEVFDIRKTRQLIHNLYYGLKRIHNVIVKGRPIGKDGIELHIVIEEKKVLKEIIFLPKKRSISDEELKKKISVQDTPALDKEELKRFEVIIKGIYESKNFHHAEVESELKIDDDGKAIAIFTITEGPKSKVCTVAFEGNCHISGKELRKLLFTREDWLFGFLDGSGGLQRDRLEGDKHIIEQYYQSKGYMKAKVRDVDVITDEQTKNFIITFHIVEGDRYTIKDVKAFGNDILKDEFLVSRIPIKPGDLYSRQKIVDAIKILELLWGDLGYIFTHIEPAIQPDDDNKTVDIAFYTELGDKVFLSKVNIIGNKKTKDKVIRRKIIMREGELITNRKQELSKFNVESLGYFDRRDGVNWKITRIDKDHADLDLIVKEVKTGHAGIKIGFGGSVESITATNSGFSLSGEVNDTNLFGTGIALSLNATIARGEQNIVFNITDPWLFDMPMTGALDIYHRRPTYAEFRNISPVHEKLTGGGVTLGFISPRLYNSQVLFKLGADSVRYENPPRINFLPMEKRALTPCYQQILNRLFAPGTYFWFSTLVGQDRRDHPMHTCKGFKWLVSSKIGVPSFNCNVGFFKCDFDFAWFTPLIGDHDLVLRFHAYAGYVKKFKNRFVPYRELYHIGGPASVRGFLFGQISPQFCGDSIGGSKAMFTNVELLFPITQDFNIKGVVFYDGGTGWDNPYSDCCPGQIEKNSFNYRHAVGFGFRMLNPVPVRIDWGFKLDRRKKWNETPHEVHFGMTYDW